ncbi:MAG: hypothetical protein K2X62_01650 [Beijerinckiaceae bacterium]|jgi:hypothetical protein|nr:hypothetical protein [Beijerinckiaceae bacterium]
MNALRRAVLFLLAILFLVEAWIWDAFAALGHVLARALRLSRLVDAARASVRKLPAFATLFLFLIPAAAILPFKFLALFLLARGHFLYGGLTFLAAKTVGVGFTAMIFDLCREKLLTIAWFARLHARVLAVRAWAHALTAPIRARVAGLRAAIAARLGEGRFGRRILALRTLIRRRRAAR